MALSANRTDVVITQDQASQIFAARINNASVVYHGALCSFNTTTGLVKPFDGTETDRLAGWHFDDSTTGDTSASVPPEAHLTTGPFIWKKLTVAGLTGTFATDMGKDVWATDDGTYTVNDPGGTGARIGVIVRPIDSSYADVRFRDVFGHIDTHDVNPTPTPSPTPTPTPTPTP